MVSLHQFIGVNTEYPLADGSSKARIHLDGAASPLVMQTAMDAVNRLLPHYSNSHSHSHASARIMSEAFAWSMQTILRVTGASNNYQCAFMGSGSTAWLNNIARRLANRKNASGDICDIVLVSAIEHHANDLPHRHHSHVEHFAVHDDSSGDSAQLFDINLSDLEARLKAHAGKVNYVAFSAISNVTGIISPVKEITRLAHKYGALSVVDCAQMTAHKSLNISENDADFIIFSGHKVYAGAAPGVLIAKQALLEQFPSDEMGGGIVEHVGYRDAEFTQDFPARELPGTKNILGAYAVAKVLETLESSGFENIENHAATIWQYAYEKLSGIQNQSDEKLITVYGQSSFQRLGALSFNLKNIDHGLAAAILSDYFNIAVRNECFCAHPYVSSLLKEELWSLDLSNIADSEHITYINRKRGMLRASYSLYNDKSDVNALITALKKIIENIDFYSQHYDALDNGDYVHKSFKLDLQNFL